MIHDQLKKAKEYIAFHKANNIPYTMTMGAKSVQIKSKMGSRYFSGHNSKFTGKGLSLIKKVKDYILKNELHLNLKPIPFYLKNIRYTCFNSTQISTYREDIIEYDLNGAYWQAAYNLGLITNEIYEYGLTLGKHERLAALGSLAKKRLELDFDGEKYQKKEKVDYGKKNGTSVVWMAIVSEVDKVMTMMQKELGEDFSFYWVDAVFFKDSPKNRKIVEGIAENEGFKGKYVDIISCDFSHEKVFVKSKSKGRVSDNDDDEKNGVKTRPFCYSVIKNYII